MNQILDTKFFKNLKYKKNILKIQFILSVLIGVILIIVLIYIFNSNRNKEKISNDITDNYNLYKLYSEYMNKNTNENKILGIIEIPIINIRYPIFSEFNDELLKIAPCRFYGKSPNENGNLCIAGHNYNNSKFFSNLSKLKIDNEIFIYDNLEKKYIYKVYSSYEVNSSDLSPIFNYDQTKKELTLITCNNLNQKRLIIKAKQ